MKVAHFISSNGLFGAEKVMLSLAIAMKSRGVSSWIFALNNKHNPHLEVIEEAKKASVLCRAIESKGRFDLSVVSRMAALFKENDIDVLHTHNYKSNLLGLLAAKKAGIPIVATLHGYLGENRKVRFYEAIDRVILKFFSRVILVDRGLEKWFEGGKVKTEVINNGVLVPDIEPEAVKGRGLTIGTVGRLSAEKGLKYLIEAFAKVVEKYPQMKLLIVGDGPLKDSLQSLAVSLQLGEKIIFTGFQVDVAAYYRKMDIYVSSSLLEHFPLVILEAMSFGKAVVATNVGGTSQIVIDGKTGILVPPADVSQIHAALIRLMDNFEHRKTIGKDSQSFVREHFSLQKMVSEYMIVYQRVLNHEKTIS